MIWAAESFYNEHKLVSVEIHFSRKLDTLWNVEKPHTKIQVNFLNSKIFHNRWGTYKAGHAHYWIHFTYPLSRIYFIVKFVNYSNSWHEPWWSDFLILYMKRQIYGTNIRNSCFGFLLIIFIIEIYGGPVSDRFYQLLMFYKTHGCEYFIECWILI